ncbi:MAG: hypothetical protein NTX91_04115 [candidate division SR1 bacterium]|nr:hypothetical protein [candidate division SR1 bacterium]
MANTELIQKFLPQELWEKATTFTIPDKFLESMPDLIVLVLNSKSMDSQEEKQSWFNLLPMMNEEQITKLRDILTREKQKLEEIETKYEQKKDDIKTDMVQKREDTNYQQKMVTLKNNEAAVQEKDAADADSLLTQI